MAATAVALAWANSPWSSAYLYLWETNVTLDGDDGPAVDLALHSYGFFIPRDSSRYAGEAMPYTEFLAYANRVKARGRPAPADAPKRIEIFDVLDQTASAKLTAFWGTDYLLLARENGRWMIRQVLWQTPAK